MGNDTDYKSDEKGRVLQIARSAGDETVKIGSQVQVNIDTYECLQLQQNLQALYTQGCEGTGGYPDVEMEKFDLCECKIMKSTHGE